MHIYTISAFTENTPGVLHRISTLLTRRKVNIESLTVSETEKKGISRFTIVVKSAPETIRTTVKQINRLIEVVDVFFSENRSLIYKEISFIRVNAENPQKRMEVEEVAHRHGGIAIYANEDSLLIEKTGTEEEIHSLYLLLEPFGISEFVCSGRIAVRKNKSSELELTEEDNGEEL